MRSSFAKHSIWQQMHWATSQFFRQPKGGFYVPSYGVKIYLPPLLARHNVIDVAR